MLELSREINPVAAIRRRSSGGFTLIELLVVVGLIVVLLSILLPVVGRVRATGQAMKCQSNLRTLMAGFFALAADHNNMFPGATYDIITNPGPQDPDPLDHDWLMGRNIDWTAAPQSGCLYPYINDANVYLCPTQQTLIGAGQDGFTTNGHFTYTVFMGWAGARVSTIPHMAKCDRIYDSAAAGRPLSNQIFDTVLTPVFVEENPVYVNGAHLEGGHADDDQMAHYHGVGSHFDPTLTGIYLRHGGSYYAASDGSVQWFNEDQDAHAKHWTALAPSGAYKQFGVDAGGPCWWSHQ